MKRFEMIWVLARHRYLVARDRKIVGHGNRNRAVLDDLYLHLVLRQEPIVSGNDIGEQNGMVGRSGVGHFGSEEGSIGFKFGHILRRIALGMPFSEDSIGGLFRTGAAGKKQPEDQKQMVELWH